MNYFGRPIKFIFSKDLDGNTTKGAFDLIDTHPNDMDFFKRITMNDVVLMGYATYMTLEKPLPGRINVVFSEQPLATRDLRPGFFSHQESYNLIEHYLEEDENRIVWCIGGVNTFEALIRITQSYPSEMMVTTYKKIVEDGNRPATFLQDLLFTYDWQANPTRIMEHPEFNITLWKIKKV